MPDDSNERPAGLKYLDRLVGTWTMSGGAEGQITYEWMDGGFFLIPHGDINQQGQLMKHIEIIGYHHPVEADGPASTLTSTMRAASSSAAIPTRSSQDTGPPHRPRRRSSRIR